MSNSITNLMFLFFSLQKYSRCAKYTTSDSYSLQRTILYLYVWRAPITLKFWGVEREPHPNLVLNIEYRKEREKTDNMIAKDEIRKRREQQGIYCL